MNRTVRKQVKELIHGMDARIYRRGYDWNGYEVYEPVYFRRKCIGGPLVIFVKGDKAWLASNEEGYAYIHYSIEKKEGTKKVSNEDNPW
ncbi:MAG: hypothetical protein LUD50_01805 [Clostridia bacterium]|nr:hypothetical protein [Clostridia bacterium]